MSISYDAIIIDVGQADTGQADTGQAGPSLARRLLDVIYAKRSCPVIQRAMQIHPAVSELIPTMLGELKTLSPPEQ
jgi:hypothetical protein